jgi:Mg-chelatase subunit ChlD
VQQANSAAVRRSSLRRGALLLSGCVTLGLLGCGQTVHTLGSLADDTTEQNPCREEAACDAGRGGASAAGGASSSGGRQASAGGAAKDASAAAGAPGFDGGADAAVCVPSRVRAVRKGENLVFVIDSSPSVVLQPVWPQLVAAFARFVDDTANAGIGVGMVYFDLLNCEPDFYATPRVAIGELPAVAQAVKGSFPVPLAGKPLVPALTGAAAYVRSELQASPDRDTALVLVSDGFGLDLLCASTEAKAVAATSAALSDKPPARTHVIALGAGPSLLDPLDANDVGPLHQIAAAGGTGQARVVVFERSPDDQIDQALAQVRDAAKPCAFELPEALDAERATIEWQLTATATPVVLPRFASRDACAGRQGAFVDAALPGWLEACPASCGDLRSAAPGRVWVTEECPSGEPPR